MNPHVVTEQFEAALCEYTGARFAVSTTSCTMALLLACAYWRGPAHATGSHITIPSHTYVGVPMSIMHAGWRVGFEELIWTGGYSLEPLPVVDSARHFTSGMYVEGVMQCVSFGWSKTLAIGQGGCVLHDNEEADAWLRRARYDGRTAGSDAPPTHLGYHAYMMPRDAAEGLSRLAVLPRHNDPLPNSEYMDLSTLEVFR